MTYLFNAISVVILAFILGLTVYQNRTIDELRKRVNELEKWIYYLSVKKRKEGYDDKQRVYR